MVVFNWWEISAIISAWNSFLFEADLPAHAVLWQVFVLCPAKWQALPRCNRPDPVFFPIKNTVDLVWQTRSLRLTPTNLRYKHARQNKCRKIMQTAACQPHTKKTINAAAASILSAMINLLYSGLIGNFPFSSFCPILHAISNTSNSMKQAWTLWIFLNLLTQTLHIHRQRIVIYIFARCIPYLLK